MGSDLTGAFRTHQRYLEAFARIATDGERTFPAIYHSLEARLLASGEQPQIKAHISGLQQVRRSLESAWGTELLLLLSHHLLEGDEIVRVSNNWNVVQAYYALYHATQAVLGARGYERPESHPKTQKMFLDLWGKLPVQFAPWSLTVGSDGHQPAAVRIEPLHVWTTVTRETCWSIACKALHTTRDDAVRDRRAAAREEKRKDLRRRWTAKQAGRRASSPHQPRFPLPRLTSDEKLRVNTTTRPYTLLDYLYRLRIRTNYVDSAMFTDGPEDPSESISVRVALLQIVSTSLHVSERLLCTAPDGKQALSEWGRRWCAANVPADMPFGVSQRTPGLLGT